MPEGEEHKKFLESKGVDPKAGCSKCGRGGFSVVSGYFCLTGSQEAECNEDMDFKLPCILTYCAHCGHVSLYAVPTFTPSS